MAELYFPKKGDRVRVVEVSPHQGFIAASVKVGEVHVVTYDAWESAPGSSAGSGWVCVVVRGEGSGTWCRVEPVTPSPEAEGPKVDETKAPDPLPEGSDEHGRG